MDKITVLFLRLSLFSLIQFAVRAWRSSMAPGKVAAPIIADQN